MSKIRAETSALTRRRLLAGATVVAASVAPSAFAQAVTAPAPGAAADSEIGTVWWSELRTRNLERARDFYSQVAGWSADMVAASDMSRPPKEGEEAYTLFTANGHEVAGASRMDDSEFGGVPAMWITYIQVADVDVAARRAAELGGKLLNEPSDVPNVGRIAIVQDPEGARFGLVTPLPAASR
jgi:predicted enzyme related to lactoylglutathione lyase